jgi:T-complex protein 1 subunit eta
MVTKKCVNKNRVVGGGGAVEMAVSTVLMEYAMSIEGKLQMVVEALARSLEVIPRQLCDNAGFTSTETMNKLRHLHHEAKGVCWFGVDVDKEDVCDTLEKGVWEPLASKINSISSACEAACAILSVDQTVKNPKSQQAQLEAQPPNLGNLAGAAKQGGAGMGGMNLNGMKVLKGRGGK